VTYRDHITGFDAAPIRTVKTENGHFRISLAPGTYRLRGNPDIDTGVEMIRPQPLSRRSIEIAAQPVTLGHLADRTFLAEALTLSIARRSNGPRPLKVDTVERPRGGGRGVSR
jgi:hypothetical protein